MILNSTGDTLSLRYKKILCIYIFLQFPVFYAIYILFNYDWIENFKYTLNKVILAIKKNSDVFSEYGKEAVCTIIMNNKRDNGFQHINLRIMVL